jgi:flagellin
MIINHNLMAMNTHRQLGINNTAGSKSLEKLSSGFRINRAGDDAAGLAISEKMRGQIRGLSQASRNAQDGISLIQTAEGALNETHSILQRMRELAVQASTDTNTDTDRGEIQKEIDQLVSEIDRIGNTTEFNTKKLINGGANVSGTVGSNLDGVVSIKGGSGETTVGTALAITDTTLATAATATRTGAFNSGAVAASGLKFSINGTSFSFAEGTTNEQVAEAINDAGLGVTATVTEANLVVTTDAVGTGAKLTSDLTMEGTIATASGTDATIAITGTPQYSAQGNKITIESGAAKGLELEVHAAASNLTADNLVTVTNNGTLSFQIGANEGQMMGLGIADMRAEALGVSGIKVSDSSLASAAIKTIQKAIDDVSAERSKLGANQNRLEHTIANLGTSAENLQAAESRIRDLDMAEEIMAFTKNNILQQAATAMLAQANQQPQSVLQLLR